MIPILKENLESICTAEILTQIKQTIISLVKEQEETSEVSKQLVWPAGHTPPPSPLSPLVIMLRFIVVKLNNLEMGTKV